MIETATKPLNKADRRLKLTAANAAAALALSKTNIQPTSRVLSPVIRQRCMAYTEDFVEGWVTLGFLPGITGIHYEILFEGARQIADAAANGYPRAGSLVQQWAVYAKRQNVDCTIRELFEVMGLPRR